MSRTEASAINNPLISYAGFALTQDEFSAGSPAPTIGTFLAYARNGWVDTIDLFMLYPVDEGEVQSQVVSLIEHTLRTENRLLLDSDNYRYENHAVTWESFSLSSDRSSVYGMKDLLEADYTEPAVILVLAKMAAGLQYYGLEASILWMRMKLSTPEPFDKFR